MDYLKEYERVYGKRLRLSKKEAASGLSREQIAIARLNLDAKQNSTETKSVVINLQLARKMSFPSSLCIKLDDKFIDWFEVLNERYQGNSEKMLEHALNFGIGYINDYLPNHEVVQKFIEQEKIIYQK